MTIKNGLKFAATKENGRVVEGSGAYGSFRVEWDHTGKLLSESIEIRTPPEGPSCKRCPGDESMPANDPESLEQFLADGIHE